MIQTSIRCRRCRTRTSTQQRHFNTQMAGKTLRKTAPFKTSHFTDFDIVIAGDLSVASNLGLRVRGEATAASAAGYRTGILHLPHQGQQLSISPEVQDSVKRNNVEIVDPAARVSTKLLVLHLSGSACEAVKQVERIRAKRSVFVVTEPLADISLPASITVVPAHAGITTQRDCWPTVTFVSGKCARSSSAIKSRVGVVIPADWPGATERISIAMPPDVAVDLVVWNARTPKPQVLDAPDDWVIFDGNDTSFDWFLERVDALITVEKPGMTVKPDVIIAEAIAAGKTVVLPASLEGHYGKTAAYAEAEQAIAKALGLLADVTARRRKLALAKTFAAKHSAAKFTARLQKIIGAAPKLKQRTVPSNRNSEPPRVLFMPKGGVGLGHVARSLAVARRAGPSYQPVFVTLAESAGLIESFGYRAEYIPSAAYSGQRPADWEPWFQSEVEELIDSYNAKAIVFDGSDPPDALIRAVAARGGCKLAWIRRGMWEPGYDPSLFSSKAYDAILEPGEIAAARDRGATASRRHEALQVAPITMLDRKELLTRREAARAIGLDPGLPAVLLQLGSGENRDIVGTLDVVISELRRYPELQIAVAEWSNAPGSLQLWRGVKILKGGPLSLYFNAFDFSIAAAGYNTFHEVIGFSLPTIFIPNTAPGMDDQSARAQFAQDAGAAIELPHTELTDIPAILAMMMQDSFRAVMRRNCENLFAGNGAKEASAAISSLVN